MIPIVVAVPIVVVVGVCAGIGWLLAHVRPMPSGEVRAVVGPVHQEYAVDPVVLHAALIRQVGRVRGAGVARSTPTSLDVNVRPSMTRTDDAMGLFVHIEVSGRPGGGTTCSMHAQPKSAFAIKASSQRALRGFDRDLRMGLKRDEGIRVIDVDGASVPLPSASDPMPRAETPAPSGAWWS